MTTPIPAAECKTPLEMLYHWEKVEPDRIYLRQPVAGQWQDYSWRRAADEVRRMATALEAMKLPAGSHVAIASKNCAHWILADLAIWMAGHVSIPLYPNLAASTVKQILDHSETKAVFLGKLDDFKPYVAGIPPKLPVIAFPFGAPKEYPLWDDVVKQHAPMTTNPPRKNSEIATIIYTSGTTGTPKGVVHKFQSFSYAATNILRVIPAIGREDRFLSYLPLAHVAERLLTETVGLYAGARLYFAESIELFGKNLAEVRPTVFLGVPRIWEKFKGGILAKVPAAKLERLLRIPLLRTIVKRKILKGLGLAEARICISGAAPIPTSLIEWFQKIGIQIQEAYGLTENFAYSHFNRPGQEHVGTVGQPWPAVIARIGEEKEILIECPCLMEGYYKAPELTREVIRQGALHTGDQGEVDARGYLRITGRVKELFKTAKGKYVAPSPIELRLSGCPCIEHVCVLGSGMPAAMAIVTLSDSGKSLDAGALATALRAHVGKVNGALDPHEQVAKVVVVRDTWTVENEFLTPTMKLKRRIVETHYAASLQTWVSGKEDIVIVR